MKFTFKDGTTVEVKDTKGKSKKEIVAEAKKVYKDFKDSQKSVKDSVASDLLNKIYEYEKSFFEEAKKEYEEDPEIDGDTLEDGLKRADRCINHLSSSLNENIKLLSLIDVIDLCDAIMFDVYRMGGNPIDFINKASNILNEKCPNKINMLNEEFTPEEILDLGYERKQQRKNKINFKYYDSKKVLKKDYRHFKDSEYTPSHPIYYKDFEVIYKDENGDEKSIILDKYVFYIREETFEKCIDKLKEKYDDIAHESIDYIEEHYADDILEYFEESAAEQAAQDIEEGKIKINDSEEAVDNNELPTEEDWEDFYYYDTPAELEYDDFDIKVKGEIAHYTDYGHNQYGEYYTPCYGVIKNWIFSLDGIDLEPIVAKFYKKEINQITKQDLLNLKDNYDFEQFLYDEFYEDAYEQAEENWTDKDVDWEY